MVVLLSSLFSLIIIVLFSYQIVRRCVRRCVS